MNLSSRDPRNERKRLRKAQPISRLFPNMITIAGFCCGLSAVRFAMIEKWELSVAFVLAAALIDGMDGRVARMLGATSVFGAQLDSLSDFVCFGVVPALVLYMWQLHEVKGIGWAVVLFYAVCCALRLARFNTAIFVDNPQPWEKQFFTGVPSPAGGLMCLLPIALSLQFESQPLFPPAVTMVYMLTVGILMASRIPTFSGKNIRIPHEMILPFMIASAFVVVLFIIEPWMMLTLLGLLYIALIPLSVRRYQRLSAEHAPQNTSQP